VVRRGQAQGHGGRGWQRRGGARRRIGFSQSGKCTAQARGHDHPGGTAGYCRRARGGPGQGEIQRSSVPTGPRDGGAAGPRRACAGRGGCSCSCSGCTACAGNDSGAGQGPRGRPGAARTAGTCRGDPQYLARDAARRAARAAGFRSGPNAGPHSGSGPHPGPSAAQANACAIAASARRGHVAIGPFGDCPPWRNSGRSMWARDVRSP